ncbi:tyrosine-type recombinase/integrase (plasmid) [Clostridium baratii]
MNLYEFKNKCDEILNKEKSLSKNTIRDRKSNLKILLEKLSLNRMVDDIKTDEVEKALKSFKYKTHLSSCVNAIRYLKENNVDFNFPSEERLKEIIKNKKKNNRKPTEEKAFKDIENKVNRVRKKDYRLAYKLMLETGLRVHELSALEKQDFEIEKNKIKINLREAKGNKLCSLNLENKYLAQNINELISDKENNKKVFPCVRDLQSKAKKMKIECHDLRRCYAKKTFKELKKENEYDEALEMTKEKLRHSKSDTTKIYLRSKIKI